MSKIKRVQAWRRRRSDWTLSETNLDVRYDATGWLTTPSTSLALP